MGLYKHPNSPYWYYSFTVNGQRVTKSSRTTSKTLAKQLYQAEKVDCLRGEKKLTATNRTTLFDLGNEFLEWSKVHKRSYNRDVTIVNHLCGFFGNRLLCDISCLDIERYKKFRVKRVSPSTVNRELACLKKMFNLAIQWGMTSDNPLKGVSFFIEPKRSFRWWKRDEIDRFLSVCDERMRLIATVGLNTGMRLGELLSLRWTQVDFHNRIITAEESKSSTYRKIQMNELVVMGLKSAKNDHEYVFVNPKTAKPFTSIRKAFETTCKRAGIERSTPHAMRHTFASHLTMAGVDPQTIMELGGWKSLDLVMRYSHLAPAHKQSAVDKLAELLK